MQECWANETTWKIRFRPEQLHQETRPAEEMSSISQATLPGSPQDSERLVGIQKLNESPAAQNHPFSPGFLFFFGLQTHLDIPRKMCICKNSHNDCFHSTSGIHRHPKTCLQTVFLSVCLLNHFIRISQGACFLKCTFLILNPAPSKQPLFGGQEFAFVTIPTADSSAV